MIFIFIINIVAGKEVQPHEVQPQIEYRGDTLNYLWKDKIILLTGNAEIKTPDVLAKSDTIEYYANKNIVTATGNPILWVGSQKIDGKKMIYDLVSEEGIVSDGRTQIQKGWFDGRIIRRIDKNVLNIDYGKFTTCDHTTPHYYFWGRELKVYTNNTVFIRPLLLFVQGLPLFYAPFWWFPIKSGRQSGLLHPKVGKSTTWGRYVENLAYYWVLNKRSDATFTLNYYELMGPRVSVEGRWIFSQAVMGNFNTSYIMEPNKTKRWAMDIAHTQGGATSGFANRLMLRASGHFISDVQYKVDYEEERLVQLDKIMDSYLSLSKAWDVGTANFVISERRNLVTDSISRSLPEMSYCLTNRRILGVNFSCSGGLSNASSLGGEYKQTGQNTFAMSMPFKLLRYFFLTPATNYTFAWSHPDTLEYPKYLLIPRSSNYGVSLSTRIYGKSIFKPEFRHTLTPSISYSLSHSLTDTIRGCAFSVGNNFELVVGKKKFYLATLNIASSWNFDKDSLNPISISMESRVIPLLNIRATGSYAPYADTFSFTQLIVGSYFSRKDISLTLNYSCTPRQGWQSDQSLRFGINTKLTKNWKLSFSGTYDFLSGTLIDERFSIYRDLHCWDMVFNFDRYGEAWRYDLEVKLKAIPEVKVGKGVFGIFL
ncbi:MAG: LPS-assembly protein LptD [Candidatus Stahlbacteria bacterium]|nr:LPS-assembly protein LptD [Candidatus Stahlbacteria bacterium]